MSAAQTCPRCKAPLPEEGWEGLCPKCLVHVSLEAPDAGTPTCDSPHPVSGHPVPSETSAGRGQGERQGTPHHAPITDPRARIPDKAGDLPQESVPAPEAGLVIEQIGRRIGRYKLLQQIGEGGFGIVFMAEQTEPVQRKVALKVIKAGMDTREVIARFEAERQALALMDHPNIAKIYDAGITDAPHTASGHPLPSDGRGAGGEGQPRRLIAARDDTRALYLNTPGYRVGCKDEVLVVKDKDRVIEEVRMRDVSHVALFGNIQISTQAIQSLCEQEVPVTYFSMGGWFCGITRGHGMKNVFLRLEQFR